MNKSRWSCSGCSRRGASHFRSGLPNQDAIYWTPDPHTPLVMAVSDGHGSPKNFRSEQGSQIAVQVAVDMLLRSYHSFRGDGMLSSDIERWLKQSLAKRLVESWQSAVNAHWQANPFTEAEWARLLKGNSHGARKSIESNPILAYGATLLAVLVTDQFVFCLQLGDGDILSVSVTGETTRPLANDERLMANETTSLCMKNAWEECRVEIVEYELEDFPALILLSTDGYSNSFTSEPDFLKIGSDYLNMIKESGLSQVIEQLPSFLDYASQNGSGDDITLGIIYQNQQDNQINIDLENTQSQTQKVAKRKVKKNRNSGKTTMMRFIYFVCIFCFLGLSITFIVTWLNPLTQPLSVSPTQPIPTDRVLPTQPTQIANALSNQPISAKPSNPKPKVQNKIDVAINEIEAKGFPNNKNISIKKKLDGEHVQFFFSNDSNKQKIPVVIKGDATHDEPFIQYVKAQTEITLKPEEPKTADNQSSFYFTATSVSPDPQVSRQLRGYSYLRSGGWIVTLICPKERFEELCKKDFVDSETNFIKKDFVDRLEKLSNSKNTPLSSQER